ncbi:hypothetical protein T229_00640 [Tannerella sp. oral taxon BU063 isolate Cell 5]|uniref:Uncharacterized protein n=1 Tax=Tannerella sp. oral taxon BU063 isolate Cell 5 TaxID=1410950 RepID=W2CGL8_9BACT|nr:hypothetical protein T229_00640 [Tannerella sp. oral taxon BU063 isolate Cell 5]
MQKMPGLSILILLEEKSFAMKNGTKYFLFWSN